jgi:hypothetical protein
MRAHMIVKRVCARERTSTETAFERPVISMRHHVGGKLRRLGERTRAMSALVRLFWWFAELRIFVLTRTDFPAWAYVIRAWTYVILAWAYMILAWAYVILAWACVVLAWTCVILAWTPVFIAGNRNGRCWAGGGWRQSWRKCEIIIVDFAVWRRTSCHVLLTLLVARRRVVTMWLDAIGIDKNWFVLCKETNGNIKILTISNRYYNSVNLNEVVLFLLTNGDRWRIKIQIFWWRSIGVTDWLQRRLTSGVTICDCGRRSLVRTIKNWFLHVVLCVT